MNSGRKHSQQLRSASRGLRPKRINSAARTNLPLGTPILKSGLKPANKNVQNLCMEIMSKANSDSKNKENLPVFLSRKNSQAPKWKESPDAKWGDYVREEIIRQCENPASSNKEWNFKVYARIKPVSKSNNLKLLKNNESEIWVDIGDSGNYYSSMANQNFTLDKIFDEQVANEEVFMNTIQPVLPNLLDGYNITALAYGVTGAGKTYTMFGNGFETFNRNKQMQPQIKGVTLLTIEHLFHLLENEQSQVVKTHQVDYSYFVEISYLEVYNEKIRDLLRNDEQIQLAILENPDSGTVIPGLKKWKVTTLKEATNLIMVGNEKRTMAATQSNQFSSRSHAIIQVCLTKKIVSQKTKEKIIIKSKLNFVDLAGSEKDHNGSKDNRFNNFNVNIKHQKDTNQRHEGSNINKSLLALGNWIDVLSQKPKSGTHHIPYRDSKLTRILKDSLGGNTKTLFIACVLQNTGLVESINTLKYASKAKRIKNKTHQNHQNNIDECTDNEELYNKIVEKLKTHVEELKSQILSLKRTQTHQNGKHKRRYSLPKPTWAGGSILQDPLLMCKQILVLKENSKLETKEKSYLKSEITYLGDILERVQKITNSGGEDKLRSTLTIYVNELFLIVRDNFGIKKEIDQLSDDKNLKNLDLSSSNSKSFDEEVPDQIVELQELLDKNNEEYNTLGTKIQQLCRLIATGVTQETEEVTPQKLWDIQKAKYMVQRIREQKLKNLCLKQEVLENRAFLEETRIMNDPDLNPEIVQLEQEKHKLAQMLRCKDEETEDVNFAIDEWEWDIERAKLEATNNISTIIISWRQDQQNKLNELDNQKKVMSEEKKSAFRLNTPIPINLSSASSDSEDNCWEEREVQLCSNSESYFENTHAKKQSYLSCSSSQISYVYSTKKLSESQSINLYHKKPKDMKIPTIDISWKFANSAEVKENVWVTERRHDKNSDFTLSIKEMNVVERQNSFMYYKPKKTLILGSKKKSSNQRIKKTKGFTSWLMDNDNELDLNSTSGYKSYLIPLPGQSNKDFEINLPPSKIEDSLRRYKDVTDDGSYTAREILHKFPLHLRSDSREMLKELRSPRFVEKQKNEDMNSKNSVSEYYKILDKKSKSRAQSKNKMMVERQQSRQRNKEIVMTNKIKAKNKVMSTIHGALKKHHKHVSSQRSFSKTGQYSEMTTNSISCENTHYENRLQKTVSLRNSPSTKMLNNFGSINFSRNGEVAFSNISSPHDSFSSHRRIGSLSSKLPFCKKGSVRQKDTRNRDSSHRRSKPIMSVHLTKGIKNKLSKKGSVVSYNSELLF